MLEWHVGGANSASPRRSTAILAMGPTPKAVGVEVSVAAVYLSGRSGTKADDREIGDGQISRIAT